MREESEKASSYIEIELIKRNIRKQIEDMNRASIQYPSFQDLKLMNRVVLARQNVEAQED